jgi:hypothetical protein
VGFGHNRTVAIYPQSRRSRMLFDFLAVSAQSRLTDAQRLRAFLARAFTKFVLAAAGPPVLRPAQFNVN